MASRTLCQRALTQYEQDLSQLPNVIGFGVVACASGIRSLRGSDFAVAVYVSRKLVSVHDELIPSTLRVMHKGNSDVPVRVIEQGLIALENDV